MSDETTSRMLADRVLQLVEAAKAQSLEFELLRVDVSTLTKNAHQDRELIDAAGGGEAIVKTMLALEEKMERLSSVSATSSVQLYRLSGLVEKWHRDQIDISRAMKENTRNISKISAEGLAVRVPKERLEKAREIVVEAELSGHPITVPKGDKDEITGVWAVFPGGRQFKIPNQWIRFVAATALGAMLTWGITVINSLVARRAAPAPAISTPAITAPAPAAPATPGGKQP